MRHHAPNSINSSLNLIRQFIPDHATIIVGLSGGPDSICLLHLLKQIQEEKSLTIIAAHLDHQWRAESAQDALWCQNICQQWDISYISMKASELPFQPKNNGSKEALGRQLRCYFFDMLVKQYHAFAIALAHHQDDQIETFFIRLLRGTSLAGLTGIKLFDNGYFRPLLSCTKQEILQYLETRDITYLIDQTNQSSQFLRNRIRHNLLPELENIDQRWKTSIPGCIKNLQKAHDFIQQQAITTLQNISLQSDMKTVNIELFLQQHEILQHQILMNLLITHKIPLTPSTPLFQEIIRFLYSQKHLQHQIHGSFTIKKNQKHFYFSSL